MANHASHAALPYPVKNARFTIAVPYLDADGDPTDPTTPDTEVSKDGAAFADCAEEVTTITGSNGSGYLTLTGAELDCSLAVVAAKVASGPKATLAALYPRVLPILRAGTAQAGAAGTITLDSGASALDDFYNGCIIRTTGGTGGGGTGGANNQARVITDYVGSTKVATISPSWETAPDNTTTWDVLVSEFWVRAMSPEIADAVLDEAISGHTTAGSVGKVLNNLPEGFKKNTAFNNFVFMMIDSSDHLTGKTALTVTAERSIDGAAFGACANAVSEVANGLYKINLAATDMNGDLIELRFSATGADVTNIGIKTAPQ